MSQAENATTVEQLVSDADHVQLKLSRHRTRMEGR